MCADYSIMRWGGGHGADEESTGNTYDGPTGEMWSREERERHVVVSTNQVTNS